MTLTVTDSSGTARTFTASSDGTGHAATSVALPTDVYSVSAAFAGDDYYSPCATDVSAIVTVQAAAAKVTGGGSTSIATGRTNLGFNAIPQAGGNYTGQFELASNKNKFHGTTVTSLSSSGASATWTGTGKRNGQPGYTYTISVADAANVAPKGDTISITIKSQANATVFSTGGAVTLKAGNIAIH